MDVEMEKLERELQEFLADCGRQKFTDEEMRYICQPLVWHFRRATLKRWTLWFLLPILVVYLLWNYCDTCAWTASAVGRLLLIQLLPYWNWTPYYYNQCLIERAQPAGKASEQPKTLGRHETLWENCALCESLDTIPTASNVSYSMLESEYLERGLPVIVTDCRLEMDLDTLLQRILDTAPQLLSSEPCDVSSNLLLRHLFNIDVALEKIRDFRATSSPAWHLHFRNCDKRSVKASRGYGEKPYYYPKHLEPYYSSWLLMAHNMRRSLQEIYVHGLIFVQQLSGHFELRLRPKQPCDNEDVCPNLNLRLAAGECLVFSTDLWRLSYGLRKPDSDDTSIATLFEVDWEL